MSARRALGVVVWSAVLVSGVAHPAGAAPDTAARVAAAADPVGPTTVSQAGLGIGRLLIDPTAGNAETDIRLSPNGVALGDFVLGRPDATPEHDRGLDLELAGVRISD